ncbi:hypothetical protein J6590_054676 [Homalodisca vitripennis]|nr:hypothetical protein J6590_054676 [Homalodisca vitripennis]
MVASSHHLAPGAAPPLTRRPGHMPPLPLPGSGPAYGSAYGTSSVNIFTFICEPLVENNILIVKDIYEDVLTSTSNEQKTILFDNTVDFKNSGFKCASYLCEVFEDLSKVNASLPTNLFLVYQTKNGVEESVILSDVLSHSSIYQRPESEIFSLLLIIIELNNGLLKKEVEPYHCGLVKAYSQVVSLIKYYAAQFNFKAINNICVYALRWRAKLLKIHKHDHDMCSFCDSFKDSIMYFVKVLALFEAEICDIIEWNAEFTIVDTPENRDLYVLVLKILNASVKDERITITALQVLNKIVKSHLLSDVLLADDNDEYLIPYAKDLSNRTMQLESVNWEIRDTTLEVYQNIIELGQMSKFL